MLTFPFDDLSEMLNTDAYGAFISDRLGNQLAIDDPERFDRTQAAAQDGADGSTHAEAIQDMRDFLDTVDVKPDAEADAELDRQEAEIEAWKARIKAEIDACEKRHADDGTLHDQIG